MEVAELGKRALSMMADAHSAEPLDMKEVARMMELSMSKSVPKVWNLNQHQKAALCCRMVVAVIGSGHFSPVELFTSPASGFFKTNHDFLCAAQDALRDLALEGNHSAFECQICSAITSGR
jgi:hypothetical protein